MINSFRLTRIFKARTNVTASKITDAIIFRVKASFLQLRRALSQLTSVGSRRFPLGHTLIRKNVLAESKSDLWTSTNPAEQDLQAGKVENLRIAIRKLNGIEIPADGVFSFWTYIGHPGRFKGYVRGRELREGCIIPNIAGGLCQLSNALYDAALQAGFEIVERHSHSQVIPGSFAEIGRDATVFWNYVDLRFRSDKAFQVRSATDRKLFDHKISRRRQRHTQ